VGVHIHLGDRRRRQQSLHAHISAQGSATVLIDTVPIEQSVPPPFSKEMLAGGYLMKYRRAISRLAALARLCSVLAV